MLCADSLTDQCLVREQFIGGAPVGVQRPAALGGSQLQRSAQGEAASHHNEHTQRSLQFGAEAGTSPLYNFSEYTLDKSSVYEKSSVYPFPHDTLNPSGLSQGSAASSRRSHESGKRESIAADLPSSVTVEACFEQSLPQVRCAGPTCVAPA
jgi:hypothetical protein